MFGCLPLDGPQREGGLLAGLRTYLPLSRTTLTQQLFGPRPKFRRPYPSGIANSARHRRSPKGRARWTLRLLENKVVELGIVERASDSTIGRTLKKTVSNRIAGSAG